MSDSLAPEEKELLRSVAMDAITSRLEGREPSLPLPDEGPLAEAGSAFVTLEKRGRLRGCVGMIGHRMPLARAVRRAALGAIRDPRFPPLTKEELPEIDMEISVLSPFADVSGPEAVDVTLHGVFVADGPLSALFLPRVARDRGWDRDRLFTELCRKAGLPGDRWRRPGLTVQVFTAEEF